MTKRVDLHGKTKMAQADWRLPNRCVNRARGSPSTQRTRIGGFERNQSAVALEIQLVWYVCGLIAYFGSLRSRIRPITTLAAALLLITSPATGIQQSSPDRPNVVLIMTDDAGYADIGSYGAPDIRTPNIDSLARDGVKLTDFYANAMSCTPTRAGLIGGRYQQRYGVEFVLPAPGLPGSDGGLPPLTHSLPLLMKKNGYATALVGKWHLGYKREFSPRAHGFDLFFLQPASVLRPRRAIPSR